MTRYVGQGPTEQPAPPAASVEIPPEVVEKAAHAMYADNEVGEWEDGHLDTLLQYRRAARIALEAAALPYLAPAVPQPVDRERIARAIHDVDEKHPWLSDSCIDHECGKSYDRYAAAVLAVLAGEQEQVEP